MPPKDNVRVLRPPVSKLNPRLLRQNSKNYYNMISKSTSRSLEQFGSAIQRSSEIVGIQLRVPTAGTAPPLEPEPPPFISHYFKFSPDRNSRTILCQEFNHKNLESKLESPKNRDMASELAERELIMMHGTKASQDARWSFLNYQNSSVSKIIKSAPTTDSFETTESTILPLANTAKVIFMMPVMSYSEDLSFRVFTDFSKVTVANLCFSPAPNRWAADVWRPP